MSIRCAQRGSGFARLECLARERDCVPERGDRLVLRGAGRKCDQPVLRDREPHPAHAPHGFGLHGERSEPVEDVFEKDEGLPGAEGGGVIYSTDRVRQSPVTDPEQPAIASSRQPGPHPPHQGEEPVQEGPAVGWGRVETGWHHR